MSGDLLLEIGTEELPWGAVQDGRRQLVEHAVNILRRERMAYDAVEVFSTPRRLALLVSDLDERQEDSESVVRGPSAQAAYDEEGRPTRAAEGFARSRGVDLGDLEVRETEKGEFVFAVVRQEGSPAMEVLPGILDELIRSLSFRKSMRWGEGEFRFARPVRWIVALYGSEIVDLSIEGMEAGRISRGHRFLHSGDVMIDTPTDYVKSLREAHVVVDEEERRRLVLESMEGAVSKKGLRAVPDRDTLDEVIDLVEYPHAVVGGFDERFLELPREVLVTAMQEHQRYFPVESPDGSLAAAFLVVHNGDPAQGEVICRGNERVLRARLEDAAFFYHEDLRRPLEERLDELKSVVWQARLGSMYEKCLRLRDLCGEIGGMAHLSSEVDKRAERAALLCKSDLVTSMVVEFTSLQGVMGRIYAIEEGEEYETGLAIEEHYRPRFAGDELPRSLPGVVLSLAEKADNLAGCFGIGLAPSGSEDPYALRRQAQGVMSILTDVQMHLDFGSVLERAAAKLGLTDPAGIADEAGEFCEQRWRQMLISEGFGYDLVAAVLPLILRDPFDARGRLEAMEKARSRGLLQKAYTGFERCYNLSRKAEELEFEEALLVEEAERRLYSQMVWGQQPLRDYLDAGEYDAALGVLLELAPDVDRFFDDIFVMGDDEELRDNRLALLAGVAGLFMEFADFSQVVTGVEEV